MSSQEENEDKEKRGPLGRFIDKSEDAVEHVANPEGGERHRHHRQRRHEDERTQITINVNVDCCTPCPGPGKGQGPVKPGGRPTHQTGTSDGTVDGGLAAPGAIVGIPQRPPDVWPGSRSKLFPCPFLFIRATAGDTGARPVVGTFWESPDILIAPGVAPDVAPPIPPNLGGVAQANAENTVYAHVWNLGQSPATQALVEFYWFNPTLGFANGEQNYIGYTHVDLGARSGAGSHKLVMCPKSWKATYENGGHECLVMRISQ